MLQVTDEKLDKLDGEEVVPMKDTEVVGMWSTIRRYLMADPNGSAYVPARPKSARQSLWRDLDAIGELQFMHLRSIS